MKRSIYTYVLSYCMAIIIHWYWYTFAFACITTQVLRTVAAVVSQPPHIIRCMALKAVR